MTHSSDEHSIEGDEPDFHIDDLPPVPEAPRTAGPGLAGSVGLVLLGLGGALAAGLAIGAPPFDGLARSAVKLGLTPGVALVGGAVAVAVGMASAGLAGLLRRAIDTLDLAADPVPLLEELEERLRRFEHQQREDEVKQQRFLHQSLTPVTERLASLETAVTAARISLEDSDDPSSEAMWRLAASMDQIRAQLDQRLEQQLAAYGEHLADGLRRATEDHVRALEEALATPPDELDLSEPADSTPVETSTVETGTEQPEAASEPAPPRASAPSPRREELELPEADLTQTSYRPATDAIDDGLGVFDELDEEGRPHSERPSPANAEGRSTPTEPMPDIYGDADGLPDVDAVRGARPAQRPNRAPNEQRPSRP